jgi:hypothetical protein
MRVFVIFIQSRIRASAEISVITVMTLVSTIKDTTEISINEDSIMIDNNPIFNQKFDFFVNIVVFFISVFIPYSRAADQSQIKSKKEDTEECDPIEVSITITITKTITIPCLHFIKNKHNLKIVIVGNLKFFS